MGPNGIPSADEIGDGGPGDDGSAEAGPDKSLIQADANEQRSVPGPEWRIETIPARATQAVKDYLARWTTPLLGQPVT